MASGFLTNDGKDLDSRYLGINAKAASAKTADTATKANTATTATNVTNKGSISRGAVVNVQIRHSSYGKVTAPATGLAVSKSSAVSFYDETSKVSGYAQYVKTGEVLTHNNSSDKDSYLTVQIIPLNIA